MTDDEADYRRRVHKARERLNAGIGRRWVHVIHGERYVSVPITDELVMISRATLQSAKAAGIKRGVTDEDRRVCHLGLGQLRIYAAAGEISEVTEEELHLHGAAYVTIYKLFDDLVLRHFNAPPDSAERIYGTGERMEGQSDFVGDAPPDECWLILNDDEPEPDFQFVTTEPKTWEGMVTNAGRQGKTRPDSLTTKEWRDITDIDPDAAWSWVVQIARVAKFPIEIEVEFTEVAAFPGRRMRCWYDPITDYVGWKYLDM